MMLKGLPIQTQGHELVLAFLLQIPAVPEGPSVCKQSMQSPFDYVPHMLQICNLTDPRAPCHHHVPLAQSGAKVSNSVPLGGYH
jgi:hypothetical protein